MVIFQKIQAMWAVSLQDILYFYQILFLGLDLDSNLSLNAMNKGANCAGTVWLMATFNGLNSQFSTPQDRRVRASASKKPKNAVLTCFTDVLGLLPDKTCARRYEKTSVVIDI